MIGPDFTPKPTGRTDFNREVVLPDGRFARITRHMRHGDMLKWVAAGHPLIQFTGILSDLIEIDGVRYEFAYYKDMEVYLFLPIQMMFTQYMTDMGIYKNGAV